MERKSSNITKTSENEYELKIQSTDNHTQPKTQAQTKQNVTTSYHEEQLTFVNVNKSNATTNKHQAKKT